MFFALMCGHALADFVLQSEVMGRGKNRHRKTEPPPGAPYQATWFYWLTAHSLTHGTAVWFITDVWWLGLAEVVAHWCIDFGKCENWYGVHTDQAAHVGCKVVWIGLLCVA